MPRAVVLSFVFALALLVARPAAARAEVIDYDPTTDPPQVLTDEEIARYLSLRGGGGRPSIESPATPNGQFVLVTVGGRLSVLDLDTRTFVEVPDEEWPRGLLERVSTMRWASDTAAVFMSCEKERPSFYAPCVAYAKSTFDFADATMVSEPFEVQQLPGKRIVFSPYPFPLELALLELPDGSHHVPALAVPSGSALVVEEAPSYDVRTDEARRERVALGTQPQARMLQADEGMLVAVDIETGGVTEIGTTPPNTNATTALLSVRQRPGSSVVSYLVQTEHPCSGENIRGRSCRGGGMPTSHFLVQEQLGLIPESENDYVLGTELRRFDLASGDEWVTANIDHVPGRMEAALWTADGSRMVVVSTLPSVLDDRPHPVYGNPSHLQYTVFDPEGSVLDTWQHPILTGLSTDVEVLDGTRLLIMAGHNTNRHLYIVDAANLEAEPQRLLSEPGTLYGWAYAGSVLAYVRGDVTLPGELYVAETSDVAGTAEALTDVNADLAAVSDIAFETIRYTTSAGYDVEGVYVHPADQPFPPPAPEPVVVWQLGGPGGQMLNSWGTSVESPYSLLPNFGLPVFVVNGSGRLSNGPGFYSDMAQGRNFGQRDLRDVKEGVEHLIDLGIVDPDAVGVTGCSYGGYFTLQSLATYPGFYSAGNTQCTLSDLMWEYNFGWAQTIGALMGRSPTSDPSEYILDSPAYGASRIEDPLLIFHGTMDFLPYEHMTNVHDVVENRGVPARFLRVLYEGHGFGAATSQLYAFQLQLNWFREHLGVRSGTDDVVWSRQPSLRIEPGPRVIPSLLRRGR